MKAFRLPLLLLLIWFTIGCNRESVNIEGKWEVVQVSPANGKINSEDSLSQVLLHFTVGNKLNFTGGELTVHRKATPEDIYYGLGTYKVENEGRNLMIEAGNYKQAKFKLRNAENAQVELLNKRQNIKIVLKHPEEE